MIPFTQFHLPNGRRTQEEIERPAEIEGLAQDFIDRGGWFEAEVLRTGHVSLTACFDMPDGDNDVEIEVVANGPGVAEAVDRLVKRASARTDLSKLPETNTGDRLNG